MLSIYLENLFIKRNPHNKSSRVHRTDLELHVTLFFTRFTGPVTQKSEAATGGVLQEKIFLQIFQNSLENTCASIFLIKLQASGPRLWHRCFPVNFEKFLRTPFSQNTSGRLLLRSFGTDMTAS